MSSTNENLKIPVTVLTGFLGSGKTTLLNRILTENHGQRIAVIENEFGEIGVDQDLVINADEEIFEMNNGCICCTVRGDLIRVLGNLMKRRDKFDRVLVETTGLADPGPVAQTFFMDEDIKADFRLDGIITLVDAKHLSLHIDEAAEAKEQVAFADILVLNKTDLVSPAEVDALERQLRGMNALARIRRAQMANVPLAEVLDVGGFDLARALEHKPTFLEPEYPFEWGGIYALPSQATLTLHEGPDPSLSLVALPVDDATEATLAKAAERAFRVFAREGQPVTPGGRVIAGEGQYTLDLAGAGPKRFTMEAPHEGLYALFTEHLPEEFEATLTGPQGQLLPLAAQAYAEGHTHDETVTSVGLSFDRAVDPERFNAWMSGVLRKQGADIFRMKGIVAMNDDDRRFVFQGVHMLVDGLPDRPWGNTPRSSQVVFIGRNLDREALTRGFEACLA
ncbi:MAG: GTP-binding protein [Myxococcales bacterium]|nr:GTP-binding protein [Myxococcales bacterium]